MGGFHAVVELVVELDLLRGPLHEGGGSAGRRPSHGVLHVQEKLL